MADHIDHIPTAADAETEAFDEDIIPEASCLASSLFWTLALLALAALPFATVPGKRPLGWVQEPWSWPFIALSVALIGGFGQVLGALAARKNVAAWARAKSAFDGMGGSLVYAAMFLGYIGAVGVLGFTMASVLFMQLIYLVCGLRGWKWSLTAFCVAAVIVLTFRVGLGIWFPLPPVMQLFPDWVGNSLGDYL